MHKRIAVVAAAVFFSVLANVACLSLLRAASSGTIVIAEVLTGTSQSASAEFVELHNQTNTDISVEGWKIQYLSATGTSVNIRATLHGMLKAHGSLLATTAEFGAGDETLGSGMPESGGRLKLVDEAGVVIDSLSWGSGTLQSEGLSTGSPQRGHSLARNSLADGIWIDTDNNASDFMSLTIPTPRGGDVYEIVDVCLNLPDIQLTIPDGYQLNDNDECIAPPPAPIEYPVIRLNEILPDPGSPKTDANDEFIELYNPHDVPVDLTGYRIISGANLTGVYTVSTYTIPAHGYLTLYSSETKISLSNSGSKLQIQSPDGQPMGDVLQYGAIGTDQAWAYFDNGWKLTDKVTPDAINEFIVETEEPGMGNGEAMIAPCPEGKYRNQLTNRCRNIESDAQVLAACDDDEYRSPETNRCRKITLASVTVTPCQEGYERNPDTNRCRKIANEVNTSKPCEPGQERNPETNRCRKVTNASTAAITDPPAKSRLDAIGGVALGIVGLVAVGYGAYEWRSEILMVFGRLVAALGKK